MIFTRAPPPAQDGGRNHCFDLLAILYFPFMYSVINLELRIAPSVRDTEHHARLHQDV